MQDRLEQMESSSDASVKNKAFNLEIEELKAKLKTREAEYDELSERYKRDTSTGEIKKNM